MRDTRYAYRLGTAVFAIMLIPLIIIGMFICGRAAPPREEVAPPTEEVTVAPSEPIEETESMEPTEPIVEPTESIEPIEPTDPITEETPVAPSTPITVPNKSCVNWYSDYRVYPTGEITTKAGGYDIDIEFLAKLLNCEARGMNWEGKVYTCSAILNFCDRYELSVWVAGHTYNCFSVAPYVDDATPTQAEYDIIDHVLNGGRIGEICHFRSGGKYHDFGRPICEVDGHYFSIA